MITTGFHMEPMLPTTQTPAGSELEDLSVSLVERSARLAGQVPDPVRRGVGDMVRAMNCYYSNMIEGHHTHPREIEQALKEAYSGPPEQRNLQKEAAAHIAVQKLIDGNATPESLDEDFILWIHKEFHQRLPEDLLLVDVPGSDEILRVTPGELRTRDVEVGHHVPPEAGALSALLTHFTRAYAPDNLSRTQQIIAGAASHHRLLWIHPFLDGNGRVSRLFSHAYLSKVGVGSPLWSVARGLGRKNEDYKRKLMAADMGRQGDLDGRGNLTEGGLTGFCKFFLETCIDQVTYMAEMMEPQGLDIRIKRQVDIAVAEGRLPDGAYRLLREALRGGGFYRMQAGDLTGFSERKARDVLKVLIGRGYLASETERGVLELAFPVEALADWFPRLYPEA